MRLLHVTHQYRPAVGGAEQYATNLCEELARRGHDVTVFTSRSLDYLTWKNELPGKEQISGVQIRRFWSLERGKQTWRMLETGYRRYWAIRSRRYEPMILLGNGPNCPGLFWSVLRSAPDYDLVHINNLHYAHAAAAFAAARRRRVPIVLTPHIHVEQPVTFDVRYMQNMLRDSDHTVTDTRAEKEFLLGTGHDHQRVTTAGVGLKVEDFRVLDRQACRRELGIPADAFVLLFLGRKTEYKGLDLVLQAFTALQGQYPLLYLLAVGRETEHSEALWARQAALPRVIKHGNVPDAIRISALNACDCLIMPSSGEAFGIVFLEAWTVGKPVLALRTRATSSLIDDGQDGYLVPPGSVTQLADKIVRLLEDPAQAQRMGERGRDKVFSRYTVSRMTDVIEGVYLRVLRRNQRRTNRE